MATISWYIVAILFLILRFSTIKSFAFHIKSVYIT